MSYLPPPEKLIALGFAKAQSSAVKHVWTSKRPYNHAIGTMRSVHLHVPQGRIRLRDFKRGAAWVFDGNCPNEAFFDTLLQAVGWTQP